ncbi:MAG: hypothetical protein IJ329_04235 [Clostridia bacterium]|nr:hypothetical protein [Clostridia bacterium]
MDKVILRTVLTTLLSIVMLFGVMLLALSLIFPGTMMQLTYDLGMTASSVKYASRAYKRTDDVYYVAFATETSIVLEDAEMIEEYGLDLIEDDEFTAYCQIRNDEIAAQNETAESGDKIELSYQQYVYGQVTMAQYSQGKKTEAVGTAFAGLHGTFPKNNAAAILFLTAVKMGDTDTVATVKAKILEICNTLDTASEDYQYASDLLSILNG